jgi:hypothetical protein
MLAAAGAVVIVGGIAAAMLAMVSVAADGARLLRAFGRIGARREARASRTTVASRHGREFVFGAVCTTRVFVITGRCT